MDLLEILDNHVNDYKKIKNSNFNLNPKQILKQLESFVKEETLFAPQEIQLYIKTTLLRIDAMLSAEIVEDKDLQILKDLRGLLLEFSNAYDIDS
jgi:ribosomal protein L10